MEDSLELPDEYEQINVNSLLSPEPQPRRSPNNTPPHSLAYSQSTYSKEKYLHGYVKSPHPFEGAISHRQRSPNVGVIASNREKGRFEGKSQHVTPLKIEAENDLGRANEAVADKKIYRKVNPRSKATTNSPQLQSRRHPSPLKSKSPEKLPEERGSDRKTIDKGQLAKLRRKVKELEEALHVQTVVSEELRTKNAISNQLLESKLKERNLEFIIGLKNTSRDRKNIDLFVEMTNLQRQLTEKNLLLERHRHRISEMELEISQLKARKYSPSRSRIQGLTDSVEQLLEEKESLMGYIDEQKATMKRKIEYISELERQIERLGDKQVHYTQTQRPALLMELGGIKQELKKTTEDNEKMKMENGLLELTLTQKTAQFKELRSGLESQIAQKTNELSQWAKGYNASKNKPYSTVAVQVTDEHRQLLLQQLKLLKAERNHYYGQYRRRSSQSAQLYAMQIKSVALGDDE